MSANIEQLLAHALALPDDARAQFIDRLVESLDPAQSGRVHDLWAVEARRRVDEVRSGQVSAIPGDQALAQVRRAADR